MTPQLGPTCLPFAIAYLQTIAGDSKRLSLVPDFFRASFMSMSMTFNPLMGFGPDVQLQNAEAAMRASGMTFSRTQSYLDFYQHLKSGGVALVGVYVGGDVLSYSDVPSNIVKRIRVSVPRGQTVGAHAMVAIGVVEIDQFGQKIYILLDPGSGEIVVVRDFELRSHHIVSFLIEQ
jgi:hypothetical protein